MKIKLTTADIYNGLNPNKLQIRLVSENQNLKPGKYAKSNILFKLKTLSFI